MQVESQATDSRWSADQLPSIVRHIGELMRASTNRIAIAASPGCQEYAAAVAVAHAVQNEGLTPYAALVQLQPAPHPLKVSKLTVSARQTASTVCFIIQHACRAASMQLVQNMPCHRYMPGDGLLALRCSFKLELLE